MTRWLALVLLLALPAWGANLYIRDGATGSTCADWGSNACDAIPALVAGNTYYFADGTYSPIEITETVTWKKATAGDHGTDTGWVSTYGDGVATFSGDIQVSANGITLDGATRNESNWWDGGSYGFRATSVWTNSSISGVNPDNITVRYMNLGNAETSTWPGSHGATVIDMTCYTGPCDGWLIERNYMHNESFIQNVHVQTMTFQYNALRYGWAKEAIRGGASSQSWKNNIVRWNLFVNACGNSGEPGEGCTGEIAVWGSETTGDYDGNEIYGNVFLRDVAGEFDTGGTIVIGGDGGGWVGVPANNTLVYHNTIAGLSGGTQMGLILINGGTGNVCRNNLWYDTPVASCTSNTTSNNVDASTDPFVDYAGDDLHLTASNDATDAGTPLGSPYNVDMDGVTRDASTPDVGAFEYDAGGVDPEPATLAIFLASLAGITVLGGLYGAITRTAYRVGGVRAARQTLDGTEART